MPDRLESYLLQMFAGTNDGTLVYAVYLAGLLAVPILRPEQIHRPGSFRAAYRLFACAIIVPPILRAILAGYGNPAGYIVGRPYWTADVLWMVQTMLIVAGPLLFGMSIICLVRSLLPVPVKPIFITPPRKHPLD